MAKCVHCGSSTNELSCRWCGKPQPGSEPAVARGTVYELKHVGPGDTHLSNSELIQAIRGYCVRRGITEAKFGLLAMDDNSFVPQLVKGRRIRDITRRRVERFLSGAAD